MTTATLNSALTLGRRFAEDERGTFAMLLGLMLSVMLGIIGIAIDYGRAIHTEDRLTNSLDAAVLAAGRALIDGKLTDDEVRELALKRLDENFKSGGNTTGTLSGTDMVIDHATRAVTISTTAIVPTTFTSLFGVPSFTMPREVAAVFDQQPVEVALALDLTGSMCDPCTKIDALKDGVKGMLDTLLPENGQNNDKVRIALAPYSAGVNAGPFANDVTGNKSVDGCTYEREGGPAESHLVPAKNTFLKVQGAPGVPAKAKCPPFPVVPLTNNRTTLWDDNVNKYSTNWSTAGHLGAQWASYLLSQEWSTTLGTPIASRSDGKTKKYAVLMTDGVFNTIGGVNGGDVSAKATDSANRARAICQDMRGSNIIVYSIGFMLTDIPNATARSNAEKVLRDCADNVETRIFLVNSGEGLGLAFKAIADQINNLRLTQ